MRSIQGVNCCVVGGAGFLGSHLVQHLIEDRDCEVLVIDNLCVGRREFIHGRASFEYADITQSESYLCKLFKHYDISYVFNEAAHPYIPDSFARPLHVAECNFMGAANVINAAAEAGCTAILQVSSAEIYGEGAGAQAQPGQRISEDAPVIPHSTYGASKAAIDALVKVRWKEAQTPVIALRQFNCVGERDILHPYVVPEIALQLRNSSTVKLGNNSTRDFIYAGDAVRMTVELLERGEFGEVYNLGSEESIYIYDLAKLIGRLQDIDVTVVQDPSRIRPWEIWNLLSDNSKIYSVIEARPTHSLEDALIKTLRSFEELEWRFPWLRSTQLPEESTKPSVEGQ